jgi:predicted RNase H-like nuclease
MPLRYVTFDRALPLSADALAAIDAPLCILDMTAVERLAGAMLTEFEAMTDAAILPAALDLEAAASHVRVAVKLARATLQNKGDQ